MEKEVLKDFRETFKTLPIPNQNLALFDMLSELLDRLPEKKQEETEAFSELNDPHNNIA